MICRVFSLPEQKKIDGYSWQILLYMYMQPQTFVSGYEKNNGELILGNVVLHWVIKACVHQYPIKKWYFSVFGC